MTDVIGQIQAFVYGAVALVAFIEWRRQGGSASAWLCAAFMVLGTVIVAGRLLPEDGGSAVLWARKAMVAILVLFPYCLYRFMRSFVRPVRWIEVTAGVLTAAVALGALVLPSFPEEGAPRPAWFEVYLAVLLTQWVLLSGLVAARLWRAGRGQPALARSRMRTMSLGAAGLALALVVAGEFSGGGVSAVLVQVLVLAAGPMMMVGFAPPAFLRAWWRRTEEAELRKAFLSLMKSMTTAEVAAILLPQARSLLAAPGAVLETDGGEVIASEGEVSDLLDRSGPPERTGSEVAIPMGSKRLRLSTTPFTPFFGRDDIERVETVAGLAEFAISRNAMVEDQHRLAALVSSSNEAIIAKSLDGTIQSWNRGAEILYGYRADEVIGKSVSILVPPGLDNDVQKILAKVGAGEAVEHYETKRRTKGGDVIDVFLSASPIRDQAGAVSGVSVIARNITEAKRLRTMAEEQAEMLDVVQDAIIARDLSGLITYWNTTAESLYGWTKAEALGRTSSDLLGTRFPDPREEIDETLTRDGRWEGELVHTTKGGDEVVVASRWALRRDETGNPFQVIEVNNDVTDRRKAERALSENESFLQTIYAASPDIITMMSLDGKLGMSSPAYRDILGYEPEEYEQMDRMELIHPDDREPVQQALASLLQGETAVNVRCRIRHADGHWVVLEVRTRAITDDEGRITGFASVSRDVSDQVALEESLHEARAQAERANRAKSEFLSRMSHELRTPLNAILGFGQLLEMDELSPDQVDSVSQIVKGGTRLLDLINEVLDIARIESGTLRLSLEPVAVGEVVRDSVDLIRSLAQDRGIRLRIEVPAELSDRHVMSDQQRLGQVLLNLLSNAVKYNVQGGAVTVTAIEVAPKQIRIGVTDTGPGIADDKISMLFTPFERLGAENSPVEGTGLGLALSKSLIEAMGGKLEVDTMKGEGTTFWVELHTATAPSVSPLVGADRKVNGAGGAGRQETTRGKVLYIEDNLSNLKLVERLMAHADVELISAMTGTLGLDMAQQHIPDLVLLDLHLPDLPGEEVLIRLLKDPRTRAIPVVVLSADATPGQIERLLAAGASHYLTKPLDVKGFIAVVDRLLEPSARGER